MSTLGLYASAMGAVVRRDLRVYLSYRVRFATQIFQTLFSLTLFFYISKIVHLGSAGHRQNYFAFAVVGLAILQILTITLGLLPSDLRQELVAGTFERFLVAPVGAVWSVVAMTVFPLIVGFLQAVVGMLLAVLLFGLHLHLATAWLALPVAVLCELAFAPFALLLTSAVLCYKQAGVGSGYVITLLSLIGGFYFPVSLLPGWIRWTSSVQPFTPALGLLRHLLLATPLQEALPLSILKLVGSAVVLAPLSLLALRGAVRYGQQRGTIIEY